MIQKTVDRIKVGISQCLLGKSVRYDGGHSHDLFLTETLGQFFEYVPVCPEVECGMSIPRESMRLVGDVGNPKLMTTKSCIDKTPMMEKWITQKLKILETEDLCGFIFKNKSPSSGLYKIKVYGEDGQIKSNDGVGLFAKAFTKHFQRVPVEDSGRLHDPKLRENFIENIFTLKRWRDFMSGPKTIGSLVDFHTKNKLLILSHSEKIYRQMGKLVAESKSIERNTLLDRYETLLLDALRLLTTNKKNINVLQHMMGYFKRELDSTEKAELLTSFENYGLGYVPLIVPITLIKHYVLKYNDQYLNNQTYLNPHPIELKLRNYY
ncbi:MAG: DUF1722 domain-containing protein [Desulfamplus sp.]|nr:DUF1722 domain-containing protein [Desulfamplus sp.]